MKNPQHPAGRLLGRPLLALLLTLALAPALAGPVQPQPQPCWPERPEGWSGVLLVATPMAMSVRADGAMPQGPLRTDTRFNLASVSKTFTAVAVAQLVQAGRLDFDEPVARHLPQLPPAFGALTLRQLLSHTAGLGNYPDDFPMAAFADARTATELLPLVTATAPADIGQWRYSSTGFLLAGAVVEAVSAMSFEAYVQARIFTPAGMRRTSYAPEAGDAFATRRDAQGRSVSPPVGRIRGGPGGGGYGTAEDLHRFARALLEGRLVSAAMLEELTRPQAELGPPRADGSRRTWGLGFGVSG